MMSGGVFLQSFSRLVRKLPGSRPLMEDSQCGCGYDADSMNKFVDRARIVVDRLLACQKEHFLFFAGELHDDLGDFAGVESVGSV
jgi:hypothetical protein